MGSSPSSTTSLLRECLWRGPEVPRQSVAVKLVFEAGQSSTALGRSPAHLNYIRDCRRRDWRTQRHGHFPKRGLALPVEELMVG